MHFALPPRKTSQPPPFARAAHLNNAAQRRRQLQSFGTLILILLTVYLFYRILSSATHTSPAEPTQIESNPSVVLVTVFNEAHQSPEFISLVKANRLDYVARHPNYSVFFTNASAYTSIVAPSPTTWALVPALRHALTLHPSTTYIFALSAYSLITNPALSLSDHIFDPLSDLMQRNIPVVPPDSVIRTFSHLQPIDVRLILSQDMDNIAPSSLILRNAPSDIDPIAPASWPLFFLDAWLDPLYRTYAFQKAEQHALEHIVQWHPTVLAKLALIPPRIFNSYNFQYEDKQVDEGGRRRVDSMWQDGDFIVNLKGCGGEAGVMGDGISQGDEKRDCEKEMRGYGEVWRKTVARLDNGSGDVGEEVDGGGEGEGVS